MWPAAGQIDGHAASQRSPVNQNLIRRNSLDLSEPIVSGVRGGITSFFAGLPRALAIAGVVEDEDRHMEELMPIGNGVGAIAEIARVAVTIKQRAGGMFVGRAFDRTPPGMQGRAIGRVQRHVLDL